MSGKSTGNIKVKKMGESAFFGLSCSYDAVGDDEAEGLICSFKVEADYEWEV